MNGKALADRLTAVLPEMRVLFTSGYTVHVTVPHGVSSDDATLLQKPYDTNRLLAAIDKRLES